MLTLANERLWTEGVLIELSTSCLQLPELPVFLLLSVSSRTFCQKTHALPYPAQFPLPFPSLPTPTCRYSIQSAISTLSPSFLAFISPSVPLCTPTTTTVALSCSHNPYFCLYLQWRRCQGSVIGIQALSEPMQSPVSRIRVETSLSGFPR